MAEKKQEANVLAIEGGDNMHAVGNVFDEKIGWLRSIATTWIQADPEDAVACSALAHIESVIRKLEKRFGSSPDAIAESRELALDIVALVEAVMAFQAERAPMTPDRIADFKRREQSEKGKLSGIARRANRPWVPHATELALVIRAEHPDYAQDKVAEEIFSGWKLGNVQPPGHAVLKQHIGKLKKADVLPRRTVR
jgi:hypothetical protein